MSDAPVWQAMGQFEVMASADEVRCFINSLASIDPTIADRPDGTIPETYPVSWLMRPDIREAILTIPHFTHGACIHVAQNIETLHTLSVGTPYRMMVRWRTLDEALHIFEIAADVQHHESGLMLRMTSTLRTLSNAMAHA